MSFKRPRTHSSSSSSLDTTSKTTRLSPTHTRLLCTLPPTCNPPHNSPTAISSTSDLEMHYASFHAHVCEQPSCGCVFPEPRLLELHQTECHDPIAALRKDRGEKIFACHLPSCPRLFRTPKTRRLHLIQAHGFPKEFFFAVTNKGVGGLLKRWGEGASMIRGEWTPREGTQELEGDDSDEEIHDEEMSDGEPIQKSNVSPLPTSHTKSNPNPNPNSTSLDALTSSMTSLSLVPPSIRFGRGGKNGGFVHRGGHPAHPSVIERQHQQKDYSADSNPDRRKGDTYPAINNSGVCEPVQTLPIDDRDDDDNDDNDFLGESPEPTRSPRTSAKHPTTTSTAPVPVPIQVHRGRGHGHPGGVIHPRRRFVQVRGAARPGGGRGGLVIRGGRMDVDRGGQVIRGRMGVDLTARGGRGGFVRGRGGGSGMGRRAGAVRGGAGEGRG